MLDILSNAVVADKRNFTNCLDCFLLKVFVLDADCPEQTLHDEITLLFVGKVWTRLRHRSIQRLDSDDRQLYHLWINVADSAVQDLTNLVISKFLLEVIGKELHHHAHGLHSCQSVVEFFCSRVLRHGLQKLVPLAVRDLNCSDDAEADACVLERISVLVLQNG